MLMQCVKPNYSVFVDDFPFYGHPKPLGLGNPQSASALQTLSASAAGFRHLYIPSHQSYYQADCFRIKEKKGKWLRHNTKNVTECYRSMLKIIFYPRVDSVNFWNQND
uniref:Uncharacterized protein n=1 Tax=Romanomermis culicivorax TaxID=13658 RepID=A0A915L7K7_ROMCU